MEDEKKLTNKKENVKKHPHQDHRQRLKEKVREHGLECLAYHEVLELLLTYAIPRKDTNPTAHELIDYFGSFSNVIEANYFDLLKVKGIGKESALFINVLFEFMEIYNKSKLENKIEILSSVSKCVKFFRDNYRIKNNEFMILACLSKNKRVLKTYLFKGHDDTEITLDLKKILQKISDYGICSVVLFHTHPGGSVQPSTQDIETTQTLLNMCLVHGVDFDDHIVLNEFEHYSFKKHGITEKMKMKYTSTFSSSDIISLSKRK